MSNEEKANNPSSEKPSYEKALESLDQIVRHLEEDNPPLEELVASYQKGTELYKICEERLNQAEMMIEQLQQNESKAKEPRS